MKEVFLLLVAISMFLGLIGGRILIWRENKKLEQDDQVDS